MSQKVQLKRSSVVTNGTPKLPTSSQVEVGELAINFAEGYETLSTKNNNNNIATFSSDAVLDKKYISSGAVVSALSAVTVMVEDDEYVIAQALNSQNDRIEALEDSQIDPNDYYDKTAADSLFLSYDTPIPTEESIENSGFTKNRGNAKIFYGVCTAASTSIVKSVVCPDFTNEDLVSGALIFVTFKNANTADEEDLKMLVNGVGDGLQQRIKYHTSTSQYNGSSPHYAIHSGVTYLFTYDGASWFLLTGDTDKDTTYSDITQAEAQAGTSTLSRTITAASLKRDIEYRMVQNQPDWSETATTSPSFIKNKPSLSSYFDDVEYDSSTKRINFKNNNSVIDYVDATDFIKDGMVSSVTVSNGNLVVSFNTEAGREDIELALTQIFNPSNYYDKTTADGKFLTGFTETDPTVPSWAKQSTKPTYSASEVGALPTGTTLDNIADGTTRKLSNYSLTSHTHSEYATTSHTHTAAEVGAMATSERNNYLPTGTTLDNIADGSTRKLSNYSLTGHTHDNYSLTSHTHSQYASTAHTHTASEVGALPTGTTLDNIADGSTRKLSNYSLTSHTHSNYSLTSHTHSQYASTAHTHTAAEVGALPSTTEIPTQASILSSGFTKNAGTLTGVTINGSAATVSNGNANFNIELGGGGSGSGLPTVSASDNGKILQVVDGQWTLVTPTVVYTGNGTPDNVLGNDGDIYLQTS